MAEIIRSPYDQELFDTRERIRTYTIHAEANTIATLFKRPEAFLEVDLKADDFLDQTWRTYFRIAQGVMAEGKKTLDDMTVSFYLQKHPDLEKAYYEDGGYDLIVGAVEYVRDENLEAYITEMKKWKFVRKLSEYGLVVKHILDEFVNMSADEIYDKYQGILDSSYSNANSNEESVDLTNDIGSTIIALNEGQAIGLPYYNLPILTKETGGQYLGSITLLGGLSNAGKSTVARSSTIPSILESGERIVVMLNEDSIEKWQREMLIWVCNNVLGYSVTKQILRDGHFSEEDNEMFNKAAEWLITHEGQITIIPFTQYKTQKAIRAIKQYSAMGVKYFILDTFKMDAGSLSNNPWISMQQAMVDIKDVVKASVLNVHILITFQLEKGSSVQRYYTQNNIGMAKNIVDVASTCIMIRDVLHDEYPGGKNALSVYKLSNDGKLKMPVSLDRSKNYQIFFIAKNQEGAANSYQIVVEHDKAKNILHEVGITNISPDF